MTTHTRVLAALTAGVLTLGLAACGGDEGTARSSIESADAAQDALVEAGVDCQGWRTYNENKSGRCHMEGHTQSFLMSENPELLAALRFDDDQDVLEVIVGENWTMTCELIPLFACRDMADALNGEVLRRGEHGPEVVPDEE